MKIIDLSYPFRNGVPVFPGDREFLLREEAQADGSVCSSIVAGMHTGTHIDLPRHFGVDRKTFLDYRPDYFICRGRVVGQAHCREDIPQDSAVLVYTGFADLYDEKYFTEYPELSGAFVDFLIRRKVRMLGLDTPSPDKAPYLLHRRLLQHGILLLENLTNLSALRGHAFTLYAVPLNLETEACPVRAFAVLEDFA